MLYLSTYDVHMHCSNSCKLFLVYLGGVLYLVYGMYNAYRVLCLLHDKLLPTEVIVASTAMPDMVLIITFSEKCWMVTK